MEMIQLLLGGIFTIFALIYAGVLAIRKMN